MGLLVRDCAAADVDLLEHALPTGGTAAHAALFARQLGGDATYLTAWQDGAPVGSGLIRWAGHRNPDSRAALSDCPEISNLHVAPAAQGRGVGTALIAEAEARITHRGFTRVSIGVGEDNPRAQDLYARLGYHDTGLREVSRYDYPGADGVLREVVEHDILLIKGLRPA
ncbi:MAG: GNAT family N-acetyltransferase [Geodermatophilaceae bacterium]|nr:GNAT family N-acetyltransferase [Geodermatophilaceae bacterium]